MPKTKFALESDGPERLEIHWKGGRFYIEKDIQVRLDGALVGTIATRAEAESGREFALPDGSTLHIRLEGENWQALRDGQALDALEHPRRNIHRLWVYFAGIGVLGIVLGLVELLWPHAPNSMYNAITFWVSGGLLLVLSGWAQRRPWMVLTLGAIILIVQTTLRMIWAARFSLTGAYVILILGLLIFGVLRMIAKTGPDQGRS